MNIGDVNPVYKYALLYLYRGGDVNRLEARYGINQYTLYDLYTKYKDRLNDIGFRIKLISDLLLHGFSLEDVSEVIDWRDFEELVAWMFMENGYRVYRGYTIKRPRAEIDVIAYLGRDLFCIECKHWDKVLTPSRIDDVVNRHIERCRLLSNQSRFIGMKIYPIIVTMRYSKVLFHKGSCIIPINGLSNFIQEYYSLILDGLLKDITSL